MPHNNEKNAINIKKEEIILNIASFCSIFALMLQMLLYAVIGNNSIIHLLVLIIAAVPTLRALPIWLKRDADKMIFPYMAFLSVFVVQYIVFFENRVYMTEYLFQFLFMCIPAYISMSIKLDFDLEIDVMKRILFWVFLMGLVYFILIVVGKIDWGKHSYNMTLSYYMLLPAVLYTYEFYRKHRLLDFLVMVLSVIIIAMIGSRGPLLCWGLFLLLNVYFANVSAIFKMLWTAIIIVFAFSFNKILNLFIPILKMFGINSRSLEYFLSGELLSNSGGRDYIYNTISSLILQKPITGNGIGADLMATGQHSHNLFLDLLLHYGVLFGGLMICILIVLFIKSFCNTDNKTIWFMFFCAGFVPSMVSGTYLSSMLLWIFLGYCRRNTTLKLSY